MLTDSELTTEAKRMAEADLRTLGLRPDYSLAVDMLRDGPVTAGGDLQDLAFALLSGAYISRGDWDGFRKAWWLAWIRAGRTPEDPPEVRSSD